MYSWQWRDKVCDILLFLASLALIISLANVSPTQAQSNAAFIGLVRVLENDQTGIRNPVGLAFSSRANRFYAMARQNQLPSAEIDIVALTDFGDWAGSARITAMIRDPINMTFDSKGNRLLIYQSPANHLIEVPEKSGGSMDTSKPVRHDARHFGLQNPQGMAVDPSTGHLFFLDASGPQLVRIEPEADGTFDKATIFKVDLQSTGLAQVRGLALDPRTGHLEIMDLSGKKLYELTQHGQIVASRDLAEFQLRNPQAMVFAPSGDLTDDPSEMSLYIADSGQDVVATGAAPAATKPASQQASGEIIELTFTEIAAPAAATAAGTLIRTIDTSQWSPPSPDPSGIAYLPASNRLMVSDGEVDEMAIFAGANLFESTLTGNLVNTLTTLSFSDEPTGIDVNPANGHLFIGDDTGTRSVYELNPGADGLYNTADDSVSSFRTSDFGSKDPEGIAYATDGSGLFIVDGANREVYRVTPGANGVFDGVPPRGDDQVSHFDTLQFGLDDPEGIAFDPSTGHLFVVGKPARVLFELTITGELVRTIDISAAPTRKPAGLAYGPSSQNPAETSIYLADRGVDNDSNPNENDGRIYEIALGLSSGTPTPTRTSTRTPTATRTSLYTLTPTNTPTPTVTPTPTTPSDTTELVLTPVADARVLEAYPDDNYGTLNKLDVDSPGEQSYIRFLVTGVTGTVQRATLRLYVTNGSRDAPSLYGTDDSWTETGITWNNRPAPITGRIADVGAAAANSWAEYDLTAHITGDGTYSFVFLPDSTDGIRFNSREANPPPQLVLSFTSGPTLTAITSPTSLNTLTPTSTPTSTLPPTHTLTPTNTPTPTVTPTPTTPPDTTELVLTPVADARVLEAYPDDNYGTLNKLDVDSPGEQSYIRFLVTGVTGTVQRATLRLYVTNGSRDAPSLYGTDDSWTETGITWNNRPAPTTGRIADVGAAAADSWVEYDLTVHITGDGTYSFVFLPDSTDGIRFDSREASSPPQLVLSFTSGSPPT